MRYFLLIAALIISCTNDAVEYAETVYPGAKCTKLKTSWFRNRDTATCRIGNEIWGCESYGDQLPRCTKITDILPEVAR